ncbi:GNAT family N-acetyltransferase [Haloarchaeobius iranensis]|uniref:Ribosomal-protein-alanine N-acetyltransferase n=1 Tax=Haloarchaeobius iranensis TaxID=996166 RepID=A0A1G9X2U8_9EURY|nr:GNAT family N-acetyltransferase [Haloarchaeobius iranensis]SDM91002.1 ribosomal-protein-alanine N-acetyltransferase [Haloarchaeobius iranensis]
MTVRAATRADLPALRALHGLLDAPVPDLFDDLPPGVTLVSTADGVPVGYIHSFTGEVAHVAELVVAPAHRREGRGRRLFLAVLARLRREGCRAAELVVAAENTSAQALYEELGFAADERLEDYYGSADGAEVGDAVRYRLQL